MDTLTRLGAGRATQSDAHNLLEPHRYPSRHCGLGLDVPIGALTAVDTPTDPDARAERVDVIGGLDTRVLSRRLTGAHRSGISLRGQLPRFQAQPRHPAKESRSALMKCVAPSSRRPSQPHRSCFRRVGQEMVLEIDGLGQQRQRLTRRWRHGSPGRHRVVVRPSTVDRRSWVAAAHVRCQCRWLHGCLLGWSPPCTGWPTRVSPPTTGRASVSPARAGRRGHRRPADAAGGQVHGHGECVQNRQGWGVAVIRLRSGIRS
jgi:hypothetical protein